MPSARTVQGGARAVKGLPVGNSGRDVLSKCRRGWQGEGDE